MKRLVKCSVQLGFSTQVKLLLFTFPKLSGIQSNSPQNRSLFNFFHRLLHDYPVSFCLYEEKQKESKKISDGQNVGKFTYLDITATSLVRIIHKQKHAKFFSGVLANCAVNCVGLLFSRLCPVVVEIQDRQTMVLRIPSWKEFAKNAKRMGFHP